MWPRDHGTKTEKNIFLQRDIFEGILNSFSKSFLEFYSYEGFSSSDIRKNEAQSFASIKVVDMKL